jgi:C4-dicarboxylate transporter, DctM subunit
MLVTAIILLIITLIIGIPVPFAFFTSVLWIMIAGFYSPDFLFTHGYNSIGSIVLLAIPLFIMAGGLMERGNIAESLIKFIELFVGRIKGGLGAVAVVACAVFGSITGSSSATLTCIGSVMFPKLKETGYPLGHTAALLASSSVLGILIPPSTLMILFSWVGGQSVLACFLATLIPGIILTAMIAIYNIYILRNNKDVFVAEKLDFADFRKALGKRTVNAFPAFLMPVFILGGIYGGFVTPTEAAAVSAVYAIPVGFWVYKGLTMKNFKEVVIESATTTGVIMIMLFSVMMLSRLYIMEDLPTKILILLQSITDSKIGILLMLNLFMILMGMLMDDCSATMLCTPILLPIAIKIGVDPIHFAAILGVNIGMGNITPPTAPLLYLAGRLNGARIDESLKPTLNLILFCWLPTLILTTYVPVLSLALPRFLLGMN